jgi:hypothetical protein
MVRTARAGASAENRAGFPTLVGTFGAETAKKAADWLDYKRGYEAGGAETRESEQPTMFHWSSGTARSRHHRRNIL